MAARQLLIAATIATLFAADAGAQKFELAPFAGLRFGGAVSDITGISYDLDTTSSYGLGLEVALSDEAHLQFLWSHQATGFNRFEFDGDGRTDLDIDYFHAGGTYVIDVDSRIRPFVGATLGATRIVSDGAESGSSTFFSFGFGGGVKLLFNDHIGVRFDGRMYGTYAGGGTFAVACAGGCVVGFGGDFFWQGEVAAGLVIAF